MLQAGLSLTASLGYAQWGPPQTLGGLAAVGYAPRHSWQEWV